MQSRSVRRSHSRFTEKEDEQLSQLVGQFGDVSWHAVAAAIPGRTVRQCRDRWNHYLSCGAQASPWTPEEDARLLSLIDTIGLRWTKLASFFPNHTDLNVKRRWLYLFTRKRWERRESGSRPETAMAHSGSETHAEGVQVPESHQPRGSTMGSVFESEPVDELFDFEDKF
jgi:hypothetical protein